MLAANLRYLEELSENLSRLVWFIAVMTFNEHSS